MNCWPNPHVQSMIWATDSIGIDLLLHPPPSMTSSDEWNQRLPHISGWSETVDSTILGLNGCFESYYTAVLTEVGATSIIRNAGYEVDIMLTRFHSISHYMEKCDPTKNEDVLRDKGYGGINVHPYETIFMKTNRGIDPLMLDTLSNWIDASNYTSQNVC